MEATIYEPEMLATADARTIINYEGKPRPVINLCSYNYLGLANHPEVRKADTDATQHGGDRDEQALTNREGENQALELLDHEYL